MPFGVAAKRALPFAAHPLFLWLRMADADIRPLAEAMRPEWTCDCLLLGDKPWARVSGPVVEERLDAFDVHLADEIDRFRIPVTGARRRGVEPAAAQITQKPQGVLARHLNVMPAIH